MWDTIIKNMCLGTMEGTVGWQLNMSWFLTFIMSCIVFVYILYKQSKKNKARG
jgi:hypothetical protein